MNINVRLTKEGTELPAQAEMHMPLDYQPELDTSAELDQDGITMYQELIGELIWVIKIGRVEILHELSVLSYQDVPRDGHLQHILHVFAFLKKNPKLTLYFDPNIAIIYPTSFTGSTEK